MSDDDIQLISGLLLGISSTNKIINSNSINQLQELYKKKYDLILYFILNIVCCFILKYNRKNHKFK